MICASPVTRTRRAQELWQARRRVAGRVHLHDVASSSSPDELTTSIQDSLWYRRPSGEKIVVLLSYRRAIVRRGGVEGGGGEGRGRWCS